MIDASTEIDGEKSKIIFQNIVDRDKLQDLLKYLKAVEDDRDEWKEKVKELEFESKELTSEVQELTLELNKYQ